MTYKNFGSRTSGASSWLWQRITGLVLVVVMVGHYFLMHYTPDSGHTYEAVLNRMQNPFWKVFDLTFVVFGLYHGLQGVWNIIHDFTMSNTGRIVAMILLLIIGVGFGVLGFITILKF
ncbi:MAG: succinate dehydrogenase, hydrophobic membrane anchor protein [Bacteroidota bacterium]